MKKSILAISISVLLSACGGGSDGGSSEPVQPPKPTVPEETIQGIADSMNLDPVLVKAVCNDTAFTCDVNSDESRSHLETMVITKDYVLGFGSNPDGEFWNDGTMIIKLDDSQVNELLSILGSETFSSGELHTYIDSADTQHSTHFEGIEFEFRADTKELHIDLETIVDVYTNNLESQLTKLIDSKVGLAFSTVLVLTDANQNKHKFASEHVNISSEGFKAAFTVLLQKNQELFEGEPTPEPENAAPVVNDVDPLVVNQNEVNFFEFTATDKDGDYVRFSVEAHPFNGEGVHSGAFHMSQHGNLKIDSEHLEAGVYTFTVTASDGELTGSKDFEVLVKATEEPEPDNESPSVALVGYEPYMTVEVGEVYTFNVVTEDKENDPVTVLLGDNQGFANLHDGVITVTPTKDHLGSFTLGVLVNDPYHGNATGFPFNVVPAKPAQTFEDFANLIGEPVEQLEVLFKSHNLVWKITDNNEPIISIEHSDWSVVEFNLASGVMSFGGSAHITNGELLTPLEVLEYTVQNNEGQILAFEAENLELGRKYETGEILYFWSKTKFTTEILNVLMINTEHSNPVIEAKVSAYNELTGENVEYNQRVDAYVLDAVYRQPLLEILVKHIK